MLRITVIDTPAERKWILQGRLIGPWVAELNSSWNETHGEANGRSCTIDLSEVTFIDGSGEQVLAKILKDGANLVASGLYATHVVENLRARSGKNGGK